MSELEKHKIPELTIAVESTGYVVIRYRGDWPRPEIIAKCRSKEYADQIVKALPLYWEAIRKWQNKGMKDGE